MQRIKKYCLGIIIVLVINGHCDSCKVIFAKEYTITKDDALVSRPLLQGKMSKENCELEELLNDLKERACKEHANLAQIIKIVEPNLPWGNLCYEIHAKLFQSRGKMEYTEFSLQDYVTTQEERSEREHIRSVYRAIIWITGLTAAFVVYFVSGIL